MGMGRVEDARCFGGEGNWYEGTLGMSVDVEASVGLWESIIYKVTPYATWNLLLFFF